jgi:hypothetical protein
MDDRTLAVLPALLEIMVIFDALQAKGLLTYLDMQEAIARCRSDLPPGAPFDTLLNVMEQKYQAGAYRSPL